MLENQTQLKNTKEVFYKYPAEAPPLNPAQKYYWTVVALDNNDSPLGDISNIGSFFSSGKPRTRTSDIILPICFGGKLITAITCLFNKSSDL